MKYWLMLFRQYCVWLCPPQMKTVSVALVLCLNVGVDPPDVVKTSPCARLECWIGERMNDSLTHRTCLCVVIHAYVCCLSSCQLADLIRSFSLCDLIECTN